MERDNTTHSQLSESQADLLHDHTAQSSGGDSAATASLYAHSFRRRTWVKFTAVFLSVLLVFTMFDFPTAIAAAESLQDAAQQTQEETESVPSDQTSQSQDNQPENTSDNSTGDGNNAAATSVSDQNSNESNQGQQGNQDQGSSSDNQTITEEPASNPEQQAQEEKQKALEALLPLDLIEADKVMPSVGCDSDSPEQNAINEKLAKKLAPKALLYNAASDAEGRFLMKDRTATLQLEFPNAHQSLEGGFIGASNKNLESDTFIAQIDAPYFYKVEDGSIQTTQSREEWLYNQGDKQGARVKLFTEALPEGWSVYTEHQGKYAKVTARDLKERGVAGTIIVRYDGTKENPRKLDSEVKLPSFEITFEGDLPDAHEINVGFGYSFVSWTSYDEQVSPLFGKVTVHNKKALRFLNTKSDTHIDFDVKQLAQTRDVDKAWAYLLVNTTAHNTNTESAVLSILDARDWLGHNGLADGVRVFDVTGSTDAVEADENLSADGLVRAGMTELAVEQNGGEAQVKTTEEVAGTTKSYVVAVPYDTASTEQISDLKIAPPPQFATKSDDQAF